MSGSKIKSAISRIVNKNAEQNSSKHLSGNKEIADFIGRKSAAIFVQQRRKSIEPGENTDLRANYLRKSLRSFAN